MPPIASLHAPRRTPGLGAPLALVVFALLGCAGAARAQVLVPDGFQDQLVIGGLSVPVGMAWLPDGRLFVIEQKSARIRLLVNGALAATDPVTTIDNVRTVHGEQGLLGIAVDPGWPARPYVYIHCDNQGTSTIRVSRYTVTGDLSFTGNGALAIDAGSRFDLINDIPDVAGNHNGGTLRFGPDGMLYGSFGDDAQGCPAQTPGLRGVILRMDVSRLPPGPGGPPPRALIAPAGNPFPAVPDSNALLVWAYGLRNPFRFGVDPANGALWIGDVGENSREEVDHAPGGGLNFGWPRYEGSLSFDPGCAALSPLFPIAEYGRTEGSTVIGGGIYRRPAGATDQGFPASYDGDGFFSDYYTGFLRRMTRDGAAWQLAAPEPGQPSASNWGVGFNLVSDWLFGPEGALWYVRQSGQIRRVIAAAGPDTTPGDTLPQALVTFARPFPVPAVGEVNLRYTLSRPARVSLRIYDFRGALVRTLVDDRVQSATTYDVLWRGLDDRDELAPPGVYYARLVADGRSETRTIPLIR
jgi:glucose/arabinose dehydrogenase